MKKIFTKGIFFTALIAIVFSSCEAVKTMSNQAKGVGLGAAAGSVIGGILGNNLGKGGNTAIGAVIGAAVGGTVGGIIGTKMDKQAQKIKEEIPGATVERVGEGIDITFSDNPDGSKGGLYFETNKSDINANSKIAMDKLVKIFTEYNETNILIEGHTDDVGKDEYNLALSEKRASAVSNYLIANGIASSRITTKWYGKTQPKYENNSAANRALNRRVEVAITANEKMIEQAKQEAAKKP
jgi:outer membrane protein OmpA-like peptidoglycan-associated protein